jgi:hypothetical protein
MLNETDEDENFLRQELTTNKPPFTLMVMVIIRTLESEEQYSHMTYSIACFTPLK